MSDSVDNEHYCLELMLAFGLEVARTHIETFGKRRVLVVEPFDRLWRGDASIYGSRRRIAARRSAFRERSSIRATAARECPTFLELLRGTDDPQRDQAVFSRARYCSG